jgi:hypothetical protein
VTGEELTPVTTILPQLFVEPIQPHHHNSHIDEHQIGYDWKDIDHELLTRMQGLNVNA